MQSKGRPRERAVLLKNGFYIEVCNKGVKKGMKIRSENLEEMQHAAKQYAQYKEVIILGEFRNGKAFLN